jgi:hypothetical protein
MKQQQVVDPGAASGSARSGMTDGKRSPLVLNWTLDPATGKPVGRWVRDPSATTTTRRDTLASAA